MANKTKSSKSIGRPLDREGSQTRQMIMDAATSEFSQHGIEGANLHEIAKQAGVTRAAIYHHFESKEDLFITVYTEAIDSLRPHREAMLNQNTGRDKLLTFIETSRRLKKDDYRQQFALTGLLAYARNPRKFKAVKAYCEESIGLTVPAMRELLEEHGIGDEKSRDDMAMVLATMFAGGMTTMAFLRETPQKFSDALDQLIIIIEKIWPQKGS